VLAKRERRLLAGLSEFEDRQERRAEDSDDDQEQQHYEASLASQGGKQLAPMEIVGFPKKMTSLLLNQCLHRIMSGNDDTLLIIDK